MLRSRNLRTRSLLLLAIALTAYLANGRTIGAGDTLPAAYLPWTLLRHGTFDLGGFRDLYEGDAHRTYPLMDGIPYYLLHRSGRYLSAYGPGTGVLATPLYAPFVLWGVPAGPEWASRLEKVSAAIITALSVVVLFRALAMVTSRGWAFAIALVYALGTSSLSASSQGLWQHGPSQLFLSLVVYCLVKGVTDGRYLGYAGLPMAAAAVMRSTDLLLVVPPALWIVYAHRRRARDLLLWALPPLAALAAYQVAVVGVSDRGLGHTEVAPWALFVQTPWGDGLPGVLISPSRGLFVYSPVLLFSLIGVVAVWRGGPAVWRALTVGLPLVVLLVAKWVMWWGGHSWGPRLLSDLAPILCFFLYPVVPLLDRHRLAKAVFVLFALWSVSAHALGAWVYDRRWDVGATSATYARLWPWDASPLAFYGREAVLRATRWLAPPPPARETGGAAPGSLAAAFEVGPAPRDVTGGERFVLSVAARNAGTGTWRVGLPGDRGGVALVWRWFRRDQEVSVGSESLRADVPPGRAVSFAARITAPAQPGDYTLVLDLVSHLVAWFGDLGGATVRLPLRVVEHDVARALATPVTPAASVPALTVATDRPSYRRGESLGVTVACAYWDRPRYFDVYLVLEPPAGLFLFFDGHRLPRPAGAAWPPLVRELPLAARASGRFTLPLSDLGPGTYRWHALGTEAGSYRPIARATATFTIEP